jgi:fumarate reductase flavoprotein subunit
MPPPPDQVRIIADNSQNLVDWFAELGIQFSDKVNTTEGCDVSRNHSVAPSIGDALQTLTAKMVDLGVDIRHATKATDLLVEDGKVVGVKATDYYGDEVEYTGANVLLASGGFGDNNDMIVEYWGKEYDGVVYGGLKGMDGTMLSAAMGIGADTVDMSSPHLDATLEVNKGVTVTSNLLVKCGGILMRQSTGQRFVDESTDHCEQAAEAMHELGDDHYWEIFDDGARDYSDSVSKKVDSYEKMGLFESYDSIDALASGIAVDADALKKTIDDYNAAVRGDSQDEFGRTLFNKELAAPFHAMKVANGVACTTGGLKVDTQFRVIGTDGQPIPNLYAIGEIAGGYLVKYRGGDSLSHSAIGGMLVGRTLSGQSA